jgi:hypothetical protein
MQALEEFARWIEQLVERYGVVRSLLGPLTIVGIASVFGVRLNSEEARVLLVVFLVSSAITIIVALALRARALRAEVATKSITLATYSQLLERHTPLDYEVLSWSENFLIGKNGDAVIERRINVQALDHPLFFCWIAAISYGQELSKSERGRVLHEVRWMSGDGKHRGPRLTTTYSWNDNKKIVFAHFDEALDPGRTAWLYFKWTWPGYSPLVRDGSPERFDWIFRRNCQSLSATIHILPTAGLRQAPRVTALNDVPAPEISNGPDGSRFVKFVIDEPPRDRPFGFTLDAN